MPGAYPNVTTGNIIAGPCTSFTVDGTEVGGTSGGVTVQRAQKKTGVQIDQIPGDVADLITGDEITIKTTLAEATLENLQLAWNITQAPVTSTTPASKTLNVGIESGLAEEHELVFVGPCPKGTGNYSNRTATFWKAVSMATGASFKNEKTGIVMFPVEFKLHPDLTQTAGLEYGKFVDQ